MRLNLAKRGGFLEGKGELLTKQATESSWGVSCKDMEGIWKEKQTYQKEKHYFLKRDQPWKSKDKHQKANKAFLQSKLGTPLGKFRGLLYMQAVLESNEKLFRKQSRNSQEAGWEHS